jgi:hypothetical protein
MSTSSTALLPLDPAVSPDQVNRILPIRADLLPEEITAGRNVRRIRFLLAAAVAAVIVVMGGWYLFAVKERNLALEDATSTDAQVATVRAQTKKKEYTEVTDAIDKTKTLNGDLKSALAQDLPWATLLDQVGDTAAAGKVTITAASVTIDAASETGKIGPTVGTLQLTGSAADKKTIADFADALPQMAVAKVKPLANAYLTSAAEQGDNWTFTLSAQIADDALCGRFTTACKSGGY